MTPRRGRPPKPPDEVRTVRVTVLLTEREHATLLRACGGRGVASLLVRGGLRESVAMAPAVGPVPELTVEAASALLEAHAFNLRMRGEGLKAHAIAVCMQAAKAKAAGVPAKVVKR